MPKPPAKLFICSKCDAQSLKWAGQCESCGGWGTVHEEGAKTEDRGGSRPKTAAGKPSAFAELGAASTFPKQVTKLAVWDRVLSGGLTPGSVTLVGGEPGIGKSTLLAQLALTIASQGKQVMYVTGEESPSQVALRLRRLSPTIPSTLSFLDHTDADTIAATIREKKPALTIIDSVQTLRTAGLTGEMGNPTQLKASAAIVSEAAKQTQAPVVFVGQVTKDGDLAGPRLLEHLVDTVIMLEGDRFQALRWLRLVKHRFGSTEESAILSMKETGLEEVLDPSAALLADRPKNVPGTIVTCLAQGARQVLVEIQALVTPAGYGTPSRRATGVDQNRVSLLLAVLGRRAGINFSDQDVFVNVVGGVEAKDPSIDLAIALALASAKTDVAIPSDVAAWGEIGLTGEVRLVSAQHLRTKEAARLGFKTILEPKESSLNVREAINALRLRS